MSRRAVTLARAGLALALSVGPLLRPYEARGKTEPDALPPDLRLFDMSGRSTTLERVCSGGSTLVLFWQLDSRPSRQALIHLHQKLNRLRTRGLNVVGITPSDPSPTREFLQAQGVGYPVWYDPEGRTASGVGLGSVYPSLMLVDARGRVIGRSEGGGDSFDANLTRLLQSGEMRASPGTRPVWVLGAVLAGILIMAWAVGA